MDEQRAITQDELQNVQRVLFNLQQELIRLLDATPAPLEEQIKTVFRIVKTFLGRSIRYGHIIGYSNLRCDGNLTVYLNLKYTKDTPELPFKIELAPRTNPNFPPFI